MISTFTSRSNVDDDSKLRSPLKDAVDDDRYEEDDVDDVYLPLEPVLLMPFAKALYTPPPIPVVSLPYEDETDLPL